jgi:hypothetical protein
MGYGTDKTITMRLRADVSAMESGLRNGSARFKAFVSEIKQQTEDARRYQSILDKRGEKLSDANRAVIESNLAAAVERKATLREAQMGRSALQQRLADFKAAKAEEVRIATAAQTQIDEILARKRAFLQQRADVDGGGMIGGLFGSRAGRRVGKMLAADLVGTISPEIGQAVGYATMAKMTGSTWARSIGIGGVAFAAMAIAKGYEEAEKNAREVLTVQKEINKMIAEATKALYDQAPTTARGERSRHSMAIYEAQIEQFQAASDIIMENHKRGTFVDTWTHPTNAWLGILGQKTDQDKAIQNAEAMLIASQGALKAAKQAKRDEQEQAQRLLAINDIVLDRLRIEGMAEGHEKRHLLLLSQEAEALEKARAEKRDHPNAPDPVGPTIALYTQRKINEEMERERNIRADMQALRVRNWVAQGKSPDVVEREKLREELELRGATTAQIREQLILLGQVHRIEHDKPLVDDMKRTQIELDLAQKRINQFEARERTLRLANPLADPEKVKELTAQQMALEVVRQRAADREKLAQELEQYATHRQEESARPMHRGEGSTAYGFGDFIHLSSNIELDPVATETKANGMTLAGILRALERIELRGGLN